ncbi:hypothetical protein GCM10027418_10630 [Mariniluteicoccus endophyticus]
MRIARPLGLSPDGAVLVVVTDDGEQLGVPADARLVAALRRDTPRLGQLEIEMDSQLRPREIQDRIRAGQSLDEVAREAGVPTERIEPFAVPVLAERAHVVGVALSSAVRRRGETHGHRNLRQTVAERLVSRGIDPDTVDWDAWRNADRRWSVRAAYKSGSADREALFGFDLAGRFSSAQNDDARWLLGEPSPSTGPQPGRNRPVADDDSDELALLRAVSEDVDETDPDAEPTVPTPRPDQSGQFDQFDRFDQFDQAVDAEVSGPTRTLRSVPDLTDERDAGDEAHQDDSPAGSPTSQPSPQDIGEEVEAELDAYDVFPEGHSELDVLYDMLGGINEDSINVYAGLDQPVVDYSGSDDLGAEPADEDISEPNTSAGQPSDLPEAEPTAPEPATQERRTSDDRPDRGDEAAPSSTHAPRPVPEIGPEPEPAPDLEPVRPATPVEPEQLSLIDALDDHDAEEVAAPVEKNLPAASTDAATEDEVRPSSPAEVAASAKKAEETDAGTPATPERLKPKPRKRKGRASVPSWDEIMFGGPAPKE